MAEAPGPVVLFNFSTVLLIVSITWICGVYFDIHAVDIIRNPLQTTGNLITVLTIWQIIGLYVMQGFHRLNVKNGLLGVLVNGLCAVLFHVVLIAFGAPLTKTVSETFHLAVLLTSLTTLPCSLVLGMNASSWCRLFLLNSTDESSGGGSAPDEEKVLLRAGKQLRPVERNLWWCCTGAVVGVWLGAVPIPLDWDRPWQAWPISCVIGTLVGYSCGALCGCVDVGLTSVDKKIKGV